MLTSIIENARNAVSSGAYDAPWCVRKTNPQSNLHLLIQLKFPLQLSLLIFYSDVGLDLGLRHSLLKLTMRQKC